MIWYWDIMNKFEPLFEITWHLLWHHFAFPDISWHAMTDILTEYKRDMSSFECQVLALRSSRTESAFLLPCHAWDFKYFISMNLFASLKHFYLKLFALLNQALGNQFYVLFLLPWSLYIIVIAFSIKFMYTIFFTSNYFFFSTYCSNIGFWGTFFIQIHENWGT